MRRNKKMKKEEERAKYEQEDDNLMTTKQTSTRINNVQFVEQDEVEYDKYSIEENVNTINSDKTSHQMRKFEADKVYELTSVRYTFNFAMEKIDMKQLKDDHGGPTPKESTDTVLRIMKVLIELVKQLKLIYEEACTLLWKDR